MILYPYTSLTPRSGLHAETHSFRIRINLFTVRATFHFESLSGVGVTDFHAILCGTIVWVGEQGFGLCEPPYSHNILCFEESCVARNVRRSLGQWIFVYMEMPVWRHYTNHRRAAVVSIWVLVSFLLRLFVALFFWLLLVDGLWGCGFGCRVNGTDWLLLLRYLCIIDVYVRRRFGFQLNC